MSTAEFLHRQAESCLRIARTCFDLASAESMRRMATELNAKAGELDKQDTMAAHWIGRDSGLLNQSNRK
jgi:hypothetical protein